MKATTRTVTAADAGVASEAVETAEAAAGPVVAACSRVAEMAATAADHRAWARPRAPTKERKRISGGCLCSHEEGCVLGF